MQVEDKVHIKLSRNDIQELIKSHFLNESIIINEITFDFNVYNCEVMCEGKRQPYPPSSKKQGSHFGTTLIG